MESFRDWVFWNFPIFRWHLFGWFSLEGMFCFSKCNPVAVDHWLLWTFWDHREVSAENLLFLNYAFDENVKNPIAFVWMIFSRENVSLNNNHFSTFHRPLWKVWDHFYKFNIAQKWWNGSLTSLKQRSVLAGVRKSMASMATTILNTMARLGLEAHVLLVVLPVNVFLTCAFCKHPHILTISHCFHSRSRLIPLFTLLIPLILFSWAVSL